jgi:hypothetical protein
LQLAGLRVTFSGWISSDGIREATGRRRRAVAGVEDFGIVPLRRGRAAGRCGRVRRALETVVTV